MQIAESKPIGFKNKLLLEHAVHIREQIGFSETDKNLLRNHNFDEIIAAQYCSSVDFECLHHYFHGIGIRNIHNGLEFFNDDEYKHKSKKHDQDCRSERKRCQHAVTEQDRTLSDLSRDAV